MQFSISTKIFALILLASILPLLIYIGFTLNELSSIENNIINSTSTSTSNSLKTQTMQVINITEDQVSGIIEEDLQIIKTLAYSMAKPLYENDLELLKLLEYGVNEINPSIGGIWVVNASNIIISGSEHSYFPIGMDLTDDLIHQAMLTLIDEGYNATNYPLITFDPWPVGEGMYGMGYNYPIFLNDTYIGVLILTRSWDQFQDLITTTKIKESANLMLINLHGDIIAGVYTNESEPYSTNFFELNPEYNSTNSILEKNIGIQEGLVNKTEIIFCYKWIEAINNEWTEAFNYNEQIIQNRSYLEERIASKWAILTIVPLEEFLQPVDDIKTEIHNEVNTFTLTAFFSVLLVGLLGLGLAYFGTQWITSPIKMMTEATERIGEGDLNTQIKVSSKDEIGKLIQSFNEMALNLSHIDNALRKSQERYREAYNRAEFYKDLFAHDINNILQSILSGIEFYELSQEKTTQVKDDRIIFSTVKEQVLRGKKLTSNVRKLSRIVQLEETDILNKKFELFSLLNSSIESVKSGFFEKKIDIEINSPYEECFVLANEFLEDVFENLLDNAVTHNKSETAELSIKISQERKESTNYMKIKFIDNGIGVHDDRKKLIFLRGFDDDYRIGTGLGLSLVNKIIESFNGKIWCEDRIPSDYSKGSIFILLIPVI
ncbi:MAG: ATP-binding protein [Candidatus Hodarchaeales archaeon]|jgi:signal transduction histidine kinase